MVGKGQFEASGTLIIRGTSRPVKLPFRLTIDGDTARMTGSAVIDRRNFGVGQGEWTATDSVGANVTVKVAIVATRDQQ